MHWLDTVANVRIHGETGQRPVDLFPRNAHAMTPLPPHPYDIATISQIRASSQFRVALDSNRYSCAGRICRRPTHPKDIPGPALHLSRDKLIARHVRSYDRKKDFEHPDHPKALLAQRKKARDQKIFRRFLISSAKAEDYYQQLAQRRMNPATISAQIVALSEIYGDQAVARAMADAFVFQAFSCEYIANLLEQRARKLPNPAPCI